MKKLLLILCIVSFSFGSEIDTLTKLFEKCGKSFGSLFFGYITEEDTVYKKIAEGLDIATIGIWQKYYHTAPGVIDYTHPDKTIQFCIDNNIEIRVHSLMLHYPAWLDSIPLDSVKYHIKYFIQTTVARYKGLVDHWMVVTHPTTDAREKGIEYLGYSFIDSAFVWTCGVDSTAKLYLNENFGHGYSSDESKRRFDMTLLITRSLINNNIKIDGIAMQQHNYLSGAGSSLNVELYKTYIDTFTDMGLEIHFSEVDVAVDTPYVQRGYELQAVRYNQIIELCLYSPAVTVFNVWDFSDLYSWASDRYEHKKGSACILDSCYQPKLVYYAIKETLEKEIKRIELENIIDTLIDILETIGINVIKILSKWGM